MNKHHRIHNRIAWAAIVLAWAAYFSGVAALVMRMK